jgi:hypothetical protein
MGRNRGSCKIPGLKAQLTKETIPCLKCRKPFASFSRSANRICPKCSFENERTLAPTRQKAPSPSR